MLKRYLGAGVIMLAVIMPSSVHAAAIEEIVVTAQKREESVQDVPMSIQTATGEDLSKLGITDTTDLIKIVSGMNITKTTSGNYIYTIRGVGFYEHSLATSPTVTTYLDEMPRQFAPMTTGMLLDVERVEVMKGPQGTLFGMNSTGGAVNYIANKPTQELEYGIEATAANFRTEDVIGFISGPLNDRWSYRLAGRFRSAGDWQENYLDGSEAGEQDLSVFRASLAYDGDRASALITVSGFSDEGDTQRPQFYGVTPLSPEFGAPAEIIALPPASNDNESAAWSPCINSDPQANVFYTGTCEDLEKDNDFIAASVRIDIEINDEMTLTSLTGYNDFERAEGLDYDGTPFQNYEQFTTGKLETFFQEIRLAGTIWETGNWVAGINYERQETDDIYFQSYGFSSVTQWPPGEPLAPTTSVNFQEVDTYSIFGSIEMPVSERIALHAGARYTEQQREAQVCTRDGGNGAWAGLSFIIQAFLLGSPSPVTPDPGKCSTTGPAPTFNPDPDDHRLDLDEDNVSWRVGVNYFPGSDTLVYGNISKGYKAGQFPTVPGSAIVQYVPAAQEELLAYEIGVKTTLADRTLQVNAAAFYYDYEDKQVLGSINDPVFGALTALVNVPESEVTGAEIDLIWTPIEGLFIHPAISYADSETKGEFLNFDSFAVAPHNSDLKDFSGQDFPTAPELTATLDIQYEWTVADSWIAFVGVNVNYQEETLAFFRDECKNPAVQCTRIARTDLIGGDDELVVDGRTLTDVRVGVENENWRVFLWGRNITDEHYWNNELTQNDTFVRMTGMPRTYGLTVSYQP